MNMINMNMKMNMKYMNINVNIKMNMKRESCICHFKNTSNHEIMNLNIPMFI